MRVPTDQRDPHASYRFHSELFKHGNMAMASSDKHKVFHRGTKLFLHRVTVLFCYSSSTIYHKRAAQSQSNSDSTLDRLFSSSKRPVAFQTGCLHSAWVSKFILSKILKKRKEVPRDEKTGTPQVSQLVDQSNTRFSLVSGEPVHTLLCSRVNCHRPVAGFATSEEPQQSCPTPPL